VKRFGVWHTSKVCHTLGVRKRWEQAGEAGDRVAGRP
jgi:hypothetical protein